MAQPVCPDAVGGGQQVELHALGGAGQRKAVDRQHKDERQQGDHHHLGDTLETLLHADAADEEARHHHNDHVYRQFTRRREHLTEHAVDLLAVHPGGEAAGEEFAEVVHHPAGDAGVVHHQQAAADHAEPAMDVPLLTRLFEGLIRPHRTFAAGAADGQLHRHNGDAHDDKADEVEQDEVPAAVLAGDGGEAPHIADADGTAGAD